MLIEKLAKESPPVEPFHIYEGGKTKTQIVPLLSSIRPVGVWWLLATKVDKKWKVVSMTPDDSIRLYYLKRERITEKDAKAIAKEVESLYREPSRGIETDLLLISCIKKLREMT